MSNVISKSAHIGTKGYIRLAIVAISAFFGASLFWSIAPNILNLIYNAIDRSEAAGQYPGAEQMASRLPLTMLGVLLGVFFGTLILRIFDQLNDKWDRMETGDKVTLFLGIFAGLIASLPFLFLANSLTEKSNADIPSILIPFFVIGLTLGLASICVYALQSMEEILPWTRGRSRSKRKGIKILDTNVIIDGRIYEVARAGFLEGQIYVPGFVLDELQYIADSHDALRRQRGRRGIEVLHHMQADFPLEVRINDKLAPDLGDGVDARLVRLAKAIGGDIVTNDFNLNRVAVLQDIKVMNLNDLALALRPNVLPQETLELTVIKEGNQIGQGVGYLEDGTMVVVENGKGHIGETLEVVVTQVIQTERGKMIFAEVDESEDEEEDLSKKQVSRRNGN